MELQFQDIIHLVIISIFLLFSVFLLTAKTKNYTSNLLLAVYLILEALDMGAFYVSILIYPKFPGIGMIITDMVLLKEPLLYLYILSVIYSDFRLSRKHLIHSVFFIISILVFLPNYFLQDHEGKLNFISSPDSREFFEIRFMYIWLHLQIILYISASYYQLFRYRRISLENYSEANTFTYRWLIQFVTIIAITNLVAGIKNILMFLHLKHAFDISMNFLTIILFIYVCYIVLKALQSPELFRGVNSSLQFARNLVHEQKKDGNIDPENQKKIAHLQEFMEKEEPFLDSAITIFDLSKMVDLPSKDLSVLINHDIGQHFFDFINAYRIEKAMDILRNSDKQAYTISEILYQVGFNSKSSFNTAFKKHTTLTPSQYRQKYLSAEVS